MRKRQWLYLSQAPNYGWRISRKTGNRQHLLSLKKIRFCSYDSRRMHGYHYVTFKAHTSPGFIENFYLHKSHPFFSTINTSRPFAPVWPGLKPSDELTVHILVYTKRLQMSLPHHHRLQFLLRRSLLLLAYISLAFYSNQHSPRPCPPPGRRAHSPDQPQCPLHPTPILNAPIFQSL